MKLYLIVSRMFLPRKVLATNAEYFVTKSIFSVANYISCLFILRYVVFVSQMVLAHIFFVRYAEYVSPNVFVVKYFCDSCRIHIVECV